MYIRHLLVIVVVFITLIACSSTQETAKSRSGTSQQLISPTTTIPPPILRPSLSGWTLGESQTLSQPEFSLGIHLIQLTSEDTIVIYSSVGQNAEKLVAESEINISDDKGETYKLRSNVILAKQDELIIGALLFPPRKPDAQELTLSVRQSDNDSASLISLVKAYGPIEELQQGGSVFTLLQEGYLEQSNYRISNNGPRLYKGDRVAEGLSAKGMTFDEVIHSAAGEATKSAQDSHTTPTPVPEIQEAIDLLEGAELDFDTTLRIEDKNSKQVFFVYIVLPDAGKIKAITTK